MIKGIGTDIVENSRIDQSIAKRVLNIKEIEVFNDLKIDKRKMEYLCGRFAAKEAIIKACSQAKVEVYMRDIVILNDSENRPYVDKPTLDNLKIQVSISHEKDYSIAFAIIETIE